MVVGYSGDWYHFGSFASGLARGAVHAVAHRASTYVLVHLSS